MYVYVMACIHSHVSEGRRREEGRVGERERDGKKEVGKKKLREGGIKGGKERREERKGGEDEGEPVMWKLLMQKELPNDTLKRLSTETLLATTCNYTEDTLGVQKSHLKWE